MRAIYGMNMQTMEHHLICDGIGARFNMQGKYLGSNAIAHRGSLPADVASIVQQGNLCELAVINEDRFLKKRMPISEAQNFIRAVPVACKATFQLKRRVGDEPCIQYIYVYPSGKLTTVLPMVF